MKYNEKKRIIGAREQRVLKPNRFVKGCARVAITLYLDKYPDGYTSPNGTADK